MRPALAAVTALVALGAVGCGTAITPTSVVDRTDATGTPRPAVEDTATPAVIDEDGVRATLSSLSAAFRAGDPDRVRPWLDDPDSPFGRGWQDRAANLAEVPLSTYELSLDLSLPDLATDAVRDRHDEPVQVVYVVESHALAGFDDTGPAVEDMFLTMVERDGRWLVSSDTDAEPLGLISVDHLWDHGPVETMTADSLLALHHPDTPDVEAVLAEAGRALGEAAARWPLVWSERVPIIIPRDQDELSDLLHVTFDLSNFIAFATATSRSDLSSYELTGSRIVLNPKQFLDRSSQTRQRILVHELIHVATRPVAGPMIPSWLEEGVAQALGEQRSTTGTGLLDALATEQVQLPTDGEFLVGGRDRIFLSYQLAFSFVDHLRDRFGDDSVARFYEAVGAGSIGAPGTERWHVERAAREVFGASLDELVAVWRDSR